MALLESKPIELGSSCPDFDLPGVDGKNHKLSDYSESEVLVVGITCNHCPYVQAYEKRLIRLVNEMNEKSVTFICINPNDAETYPDDSFESMKARAAEFEFPFDYLCDESQEAAKAFNAACTPEFYVYDSERKLRYHGRLDDSPKDEAAVKVQYLKNAINAILEGNEIDKTQVPAMGCSIKWKEKEGELKHG